MTGSSVGWKTVAVAGEFAVDVPGNAEWYLDDGGDAFCIRLVEGSTTEVRISRHGHRLAAAKPGSLSEVVRDFLERIVPKVGGSEPHDASVERCVTQERAVQGVLTDEDGTWWLVRAYEVGDGYYWLQWCGPQSVMMNTVLTIYESFSPDR